MIGLSNATGGVKMKGIAILAASAALVTLAGCDKLGIGGGGTKGNASANATAANSAAPAANASADAGGGKLNEGGGATPAGASGTVNLDRTYLMGRWTDDGDCSNVIEFTQDGRFIAANGGTGLWNLAGDQLTMTGNATATIQIVPIDQNTMTVVNADGSLGRSTRC
jgi:hypothetical protein